MFVQQFFIPGIAQQLLSPRRREHLRHRRPGPGRRALPRRGRRARPRDHPRPRDAPPRGLRLGAHGARLDRRRDDLRAGLGPLRVRAHGRRRRVAGRRRGAPDRRPRHARPHARRRDLRGHGHGPRRRAGRGVHGRRALRRRRRPARPLPRTLGGARIASSTTVCTRRSSPCPTPASSSPPTAPARSAAGPWARCGSRRSGTSGGSTRPCSTRAARGSSRP